MRPRQQLALVALALLLFIAVLNALRPPRWLAWAASGAAVVVVWRYFWIVNRARIRLLRERRRERRKRP